jgi:hypothetical protein
MQIILDANPFVHKYVARIHSLFNLSIHFQVYTYKIYSMQIMFHYKLLLQNR